MGNKIWLRFSKGVSHIFSKKKTTQTFFASQGCSQTVWISIAASELDALENENTFSLFDFLLFRSLFVFFLNNSIFLTGYWCIWRCEYSSPYSGACWEKISTRELFWIKSYSCSKSEISTFFRIFLPKPEGHFLQKSKTAFSSTLTREIVYTVLNNTGKYLTRV